MTPHKIFLIIALKASSSVTLTDLGHLVPKHQLVYGVLHVWFLRLLSGRMRGQVKVARHLHTAHFILITCGQPIFDYIWII